MKKVLFVCLGNICRSPMAEIVFREKVKDSGLADKIQVSSRATGSWNDGDAPHKGTQDKLKEVGLSCDGLFAEKISSDDFHEYDYIIGMDENNIRDLEGLSPDIDSLHKIHLLLSEEVGLEKENIPDPYYTGDFDLTYELVDKGTTKWLEKIKEEL
ncbi:MULTISPECIES: low molecular weight protein-tyrosine-phosphatase [Vagococcus]|uniref:low molecular weight protein-tyrosine-phosphatase n=1 Tax=Vagococcus TaxID=2737 RepID=UPI000E4CD694|nr:MULTISPECIES: low molecular weight protein-tyrosine-phosphatase [Vagococcus]RHH67593.1 low molecular weight phosphotyrosine protein phosphatase [Vagococcus sp. AM17-17]